MVDACPFLDRALCWRYFMISHWLTESKGKKSGLCVSRRKAKDLTQSSPFEPALPVLRVNRAVARFTSSAPTYGLCGWAKFLFGGYGGAVQAGFQGLLFFADFFREAVAEFFEEFGDGGGFFGPSAGSTRRSSSSVSREMFRPSSVSEPGVGT